MPSISYTRLNSFSDSSLKPLPQLHFFLSLPVPVLRKFLWPRRPVPMFFHFCMKTSIVTEQRLYRLSDNVLFVAPVSVGADHLAELGSVVAQMVDTNHVITESIENLVQRITDNGTADVTDVKRLLRC